MSSNEQSVAIQRPYAIRQIVTDDLARSRATVFFRPILAIPHLIWLTLWGVAAGVVWVIDWIWTLIAGASPEWAHSFLAAFTRYTVHVGAYISLAAERYPTFMAEPGYPVDLEIDPPAPQRRVITLFRPILAIPMLIVASVLQNVQLAVAIIAWFYCLFTGRMHEGMRNIITFCIAFNARTSGYVSFLTDRYPPFSEDQFPTS
jgi:hypothetical protein